MAAAGLFEETDNEYRGLDILVNAGGVLNESKDGWRNMINTNVKGMIDCTNVGMELMNRRHRPGVIINFSSIFAIRPIPQLPLFSGTHAAVLGALLGFNKMENNDVRLLTVCMGPTDTTMLYNLSETDVGEWAKDNLLNLTDALKIRLK
ncbi:NAD(P)-binding domain,Short-chain dehydrogenase/reductase SDR [Cinara cedri]|uniref:NAD(P)-binding domain,Short-chain dehydrogenase/reductase SDR n=1 Tax=Cinara cedri TaxID=506608 RepID=A0A5E4MZ17_9HEMI|nr:NAD(P)-binding domain,Short-chain dehydrogenase/reductase SDR [Cinara cedri]